MATAESLMTPSRRLLLEPRVLLFALLSGVIIAYSNTLEWVADFWQRPEYSHGYLIPAFACALLWLRKPTQELPENEKKLGLALIGIGIGGLALISFVPVDKFYPSALHNLLTPGTLAFLPCLAGAIVLAGPLGQSEVTTAERWWGVGIIALGLALRLVLTWYALVTPEMLTLLPVLAGAVVLAGGWQALSWLWPAIAFLVFMFPLPDILERELLTPLQRFATVASTFCLQLIGLPAYREGNSIHLGTMPLSVADECSGLRMLTIFLALSVAVTMVANRPIWERIVVVVSAVPIALAVNVARITITAILYQVADAELAHKVFHDLAGWVMMPMALGLMYCELQVLAHLVHEDDDVATDLMDSTIGPGVTAG
jgi:exosortase